MPWGLLQCATPPKSTLLFPFLKKRDARLSKPYFCFLARKTIFYQTNANQFRGTEFFDIKVKSNGFSTKNGPRKTKSGQT